MAIFSLSKTEVWQANPSRAEILSAPLVSARRLQQALLASLKQVSKYV